MEHSDVTPSIEKVEILIGAQTDGCTYSLHPASRQLILRRFPGVHPAPAVFVGYDTRSDFERYHGPMWKQIVLLLTGLNEDQVRQLGGFRLYDPTREVLVYESVSGR